MEKCKPLLASYEGCLINFYYFKMKKPNTKIYRADALMLVTAIIWGSGFVAQRAGMDHIGPFVFNGIRFALGALVLLPLMKYKGKQPDSDKKRTQSLLWGGGIAGCVLFIAATLQQIGLVYTTAGKAGFITGLYVIFVALMAWFGGYKPDAGSWLGAVLACFGLYFLSVTENLTFAPGDLWVLIGAVFWAAHVLILSHIAPKMDGLRLACTQFAVCSFLSLLVAVIFETNTLLVLKAALIPILYGGFMSVGAGYTLQVIAQKDAPPVHAAIILSLEAVFGAVAGWLVLDEALSLRMFIGCALMLTGILTAQMWSQMVNSSRMLQLKQACIRKN